MNSSVIMFLLAKCNFSWMLPGPCSGSSRSHQWFAHRSKRFWCGGTTGEAPGDARESQGTPRSQQTPEAWRGGQRITEPEPSGHSGAYSPRPGSCSGGC